MATNGERSIELERARNLWASFVRKFEPHTRSTAIDTDLDFDFERIGGLAGPKEELLTYAYAATGPEVYEHWGTYPPSGLLLVGQSGGGKSLLARALSTQAGTAIIQIDVPHLVLDVVQSAGKTGEFTAGWSQILEEMPAVTIHFDELEFSRAQEIGSRRTDLPIGPIMDFLLEMIDRTVISRRHLVIGTTSHPDTLRRAFVAAGRFERVVEVNPTFPEDVLAALRIHASEAEERAGRQLFEEVDWADVVSDVREPAIRDWVRILHAVLRRKARLEAAREVLAPIQTDDLKQEVERYRQAQQRIPHSTSGNYL